MPYQPAGDDWDKVAERAANAKDEIGDFSRPAGDRAPRHKCRSCGAAMVWAVTPTGKNCPIDVKAVPDGNITLRKGDDGKVEAHFIAAGEKVAEGVKRFKSHFATCRHASQHRRGR